LFVRRWKDAYDGFHAAKDLHVFKQGGYLSVWVLEPPGQSGAALIVEAFISCNKGMVKHLKSEEAYFNRILGTFVKMYITYPDVIHISRGVVDRPCGLRLLDTFEKFVKGWDGVPYECLPSCLQINMENFGLAIEIGKAL
jgi:hypothetical protein